MQPDHTPWERLQSGAMLWSTAIERASGRSDERYSKANVCRHRQPGDALFKKSRNWTSFNGKEGLEKSNGDAGNPLDWIAFAAMCPRCLYCRKQDDMCPSGRDAHGELIHEIVVWSIVTSSHARASQLRVTYVLLGWLA